jgi:hypothetical protein|tara:strand:+ start:10013 stop:10327 length:315 start_codon:yes stop_codon:yes gene_type:complete
MAIVTNDSSKSYTRYNYGVTYLNHKERTTTTSVGSEYDDFLIRFDGVSSKAGRVPSFCTARPDQISEIFYDSPGYWWYTMQYNSYFDPFENLTAGSTISIPELQ